MSALRPGGTGFDPGLPHTKVIQDDSSCSLLGTQGPVPQSIVSLTTSTPTSLLNPLLFFVEKFENLLQDSHIFPTKNISVFVIFTF